ncbi:MAG: hypothetical protein WCD38_04955 [Candidatus Tumulicola sp.]
MEPQRGSALVETAIAVAIAGLVAGAVLDATVLATRSAGMRPIRDALENEVRRELPVALDVLKYQGGTIVPAAIATTLPMPAGSPLAARVSITVSPDPSGAISVTVTARAGNPAQHATLSSTVGAQAPLPGTVITAPGLVPAPTGAP